MMALLGYKRTPIPFISGERSMSRILRRTKQESMPKGVTIFMETRWPWMPLCKVASWKQMLPLPRSRGVNHKIIEVIGFYHVVLFFIQVFFLMLLYTQDLSHGYWIPKMMVFMASFWVYPFAIFLWFASNLGKWYRPNRPLVTPNGGEKQGNSLQNRHKNSRNFPRIHSNSSCCR